MVVVGELCKGRKAVAWVTSPHFCPVIAFEVHSTALLSGRWRGGLCGQSQGPPMCHGEMLSS